MMSLYYSKQLDGTFLCGFFVSEQVIGLQQAEDVDHLLWETNKASL